jgi:large conductance mechanosensitive channel
VGAIVKDLLTPPISAIGKLPDFSALFFTINGSKFIYGDFINATLGFTIAALSVYFLVVMPMNPLAGEDEEGTRSDDAELRGMPQRDPAASETMQVLHGGHRVDVSATSI